VSETATRYREIAVTRALKGPGSAHPEARLAAFENQVTDAAVRPLVDKIARRAWTVTDADVAAAKAAGLSEDEIFELTVCAAYGQATRQLEAALAALDEATVAVDTHQRIDSTSCLINRRSFPTASEQGERATRPERAGEAAREGACRESEGRSPSDKTGVAR
jgi:hypothetical protein